MNWLSLFQGIETMVTEPDPKIVIGRIALIVLGVALLVAA